MAKQEPKAHDRKGDPARAELLRMALRENLKKRKHQERARSRSDGEAPHDFAEFAPEIAPDEPKR